MKKNILFISLALSIILSSCSDKNSTGVFKPSSAGKLYEIVLVLDNQYWKAPIGKTLSKYFQAPVAALPQPEPLFDLIHIEHSSFSNMFKTHRNILNVRVSPYVDSVGIAIRKDYWAAPQIYVELTAYNENQFDSLMQAKGHSLVRLFEKEEADRLGMSYKKMENQDVRRVMTQKHAIVVHVPGQFSLDVDKPNFQWIDHETPKLTQSILVWEYPYTSEKQLSYQGLILAHDSVLLKNVPGAEKDSYMAIEKRWPPEIETITHKGFYTIEMKGLWEVEGDFMGGPFVSYTMVDTLQNRLVTFMGFVYAGKQKKRNYIRELEAIMNSVDIMKPKKK